MSNINRFFQKLGSGEKLESVDALKSNIHQSVSAMPANPISNIVRQFWMAARAASLMPNLNPQFKLNVTREANAYLAKEVQKLPVLQSGDDTIEDLEKLLNIYYRLQTTPTAEVTAKWLQRMRQELPKANADTLFRIPDQFAQLGIYPGDKWMSEWWECARPISGKWSLTEGYSLLYRLTLLDFLRSEDPQTDEQHASPCAEAADMFLSFIKKNAFHLFPNEIDGRVYFAAKWFRHDFFNGYKVQAETCRSSRMEEAFGGIFAGSAIQVNTQGILVPECGHRIDLELINGQSCGAEVDGVGHFNRVASVIPGQKQLVFNPSTRFQSWLISQLCPDLHVLRVPYFYLNGNERNLPWEKTLRRLEGKAPGVYAYHGMSLVKNMADKNGFSYPDQIL